VSIPIEIGTDEQFAALRHCLEFHNYTEDELCRRYGIEKLSDFEDIQDREQVEPWDKDATGVLFRLFIESRFIPETLVKEKLGAKDVELFEELGLIHGNEDNLEEVWAPVSLVPYIGLWSVCDSWHRPDRAVLSPQDPVYAPIVSNAHRFFNLMPKMKCGRLLELCSGTAFAALYAARHYADEAYAFDISPRSTLFAEFNRKLNNIPNAIIKEGDLYEPSDGVQFDRIIVHPPYVPVLRPKWVFHDGGSDGEAIVKRVIAEAPKYLAPGGLLYMLSMGTDREKPYQQRIREWLGESQQEFDIAVFPIRLVAPEDFAVRASAGSRTYSEDNYRFKDLFRQLEIESLVYSVVILQRKTEDRPPFTIRRQFGPRTGASEIDWAVEWESLAASSKAVERILQSKPKPNPETELRVLHRLGEDGWETAEHMLVTPYPFSMEARTDPWAPYLMAACNGTKTGRDLFAELKQEGVLPEAAPDEEFARAIAILASGGFLFLEQV
jgi:methylase of polypeptide subunit release factors